MIHEHYGMRSVWRCQQRRRGGAGWDYDKSQVGICGEIDLWCEFNRTMLFNEFKAKLKE